MNKGVVKQHLLQGNHVTYHVWQFSENYMNCGEGCCNENFDSPEEVVNHIEFLCEGDWSEVELEDY